MIAVNPKVAFKEGMMIKIVGSIFKNSVGLVLETPKSFDTFLWVFVDNEPQWIHINDCEAAEEDNGKAYI